MGEQLYLRLSYNVYPVYSSKNINNLWRLQDKKILTATPYAEGNKKFCERHICLVPDKKEPQYPEKNQLKSIKKPSTILYQPLEFFAQLILHN